MPSPEFDARVGGGYRMSLFYPPNERSFRGKTSDREDMVDVRFVELAPARKLVSLNGISAAQFLVDRNPVRPGGRIGKGRRRPGVTNSFRRPPERRPAQS
jgi:hypothetical protein